MNIFNVQLQLSPSTKGMRTHFAFMFSDVKMNQFDVRIQVSICPELITTDVTSELFQLEMNVVDVLLSGSFLLEFLPADVALGILFALVHTFDVFLKTILSGSLFATVWANELEILIVDWGIVVVKPLHVRIVTDSVLEGFVARFAFVLHVEPLLNCLVQCLVFSLSPHSVHDFLMM